MTNNKNPSTQLILTETEPPQPDNTEKNNIRYCDLEVIPPGESDTEVLSPMPNTGRGGHNKIPDETRDQIIEDFLVTKNITKTAKKFNLNRETVGFIIREAFGENKLTADVALAKQFEEAADTFLREIKNRNLKDTSVRDLVVAAGICIDKRQVLSGSAPRGNAPLSLKIAWKDGSGAVELSTGGSD
ncbi:MAG: hypothetical protein NC238_14020 [Dehalobacter sp.]|nr:hypothetical protein [Dehalobacter sp.]